MADTPSGALREDASTSSSSSTDPQGEAAEPAKKPRARRARAGSVTSEAQAPEGAPTDANGVDAKPTRRRRARASGEDAAGDAAPVTESAESAQASHEAGAADTAKAPAAKKPTRTRKRAAAPRATRSTRSRKSEAAQADAVEASVEAASSEDATAAASVAEPAPAGPVEAEAPMASETAVAGRAAEERSGEEGTPAAEVTGSPVVADARASSGAVTEEAAEEEARRDARAAAAAQAPAPANRGEEAPAGAEDGDVPTTTSQEAAHDPASPEEAAVPEDRGQGETVNARREQSPDRPSRSRREEPPARRIREDGELPHERLDEDAVKVVTRLHQFGHEAYLVGGCVRDLLLDRTPKDFDIATSATPNEVRGIFRNCRLIGRRFRLAHVYFRGGKVIEVSTFRANPTELENNGDGNGEAEDAPADGDLLITHDNVFGTAEEDARRRDFTMNGLFYDVEEGRVIDFVHGRRDLERREIRTIGDPEVRMREDPVRILRAVRFANKLKLDLESRTYAAMEGAVEDLVRCAPARLLEETFRLLRGGYAEGSLKLLNALDALRILLPPLGNALREGGREAEERCWAFARALDEVVRSGEEVEDSLLLAALLIPITGRAPVEQDEEQRQTMSSEVETLLAELVQGARLPRRIAERARHLLFAQQVLTGERRRRGGQASFRRHPIYCDALRLFEMTVQATGEHREALDAWKAGSAPVPAGGEGSGSRPRRHRRPRRRGGNGGASSNRGGDA